MWMRILKQAVIAAGVELIRLTADELTKQLRQRLK